MALKDASPVIYIAAVMYNKNFTDSVESILESMYGGITAKSDNFLFDHTRYYEPEMGEGLVKYFVSFDGYRSPSLLANYKHMAIDKEAVYAIDDKRSINIDPMYLAQEKLVVASTKNFTHRIFIGDNIYGDVQLMRQKGIYAPLPWTYADYKSELAINFFSSIASKTFFANTRSNP